MSMKKGDQRQIKDCDHHDKEKGCTYSLRNNTKLENEKITGNYLEDAIHHIKTGRDKKDFIVKLVNKDIGKGVFATRDFASGSFLLEYDGELINVAEGRQREKSYPLDLGSYIFFFQHKSKKFCIDATFSKRKGRFVNDGIEKEQNSVMKLIDVDNRPHLALFALKNIAKGEEIRYDYGVPNLPWRTKRISKKIFEDVPSTGNVSSIEKLQGEVTVETMKDCKVHLVKLSSKTIEEYVSRCTTKFPDCQEDIQLETMTDDVTVPEAVTGPDEKFLHINVQDDFNQDKTPQEELESNVDPYRLNERHESVEDTFSADNPVGEDYDNFNQARTPDEEPKSNAVPDCLAERQATVEDTFSADNPVGEDYVDQHQNIDTQEESEINKETLTFVGSQPSAAFDDTRATNNSLEQDSTNGLHPSDDQDPLEGNVENLNKDFVACVEEFLKSDLVKESLTSESEKKRNYLAEGLGKLKSCLASNIMSSERRENIQIVPEEERQSTEDTLITELIQREDESITEESHDSSDIVQNREDHVENIPQDNGEKQDTHKKQCHSKGRHTIDKSSKTVNGKQGASKKPKRPCPFCGKFSSDLTKHLKRMHGDDEEVKAALAMKKQERLNAFKMLRRRGYNKVNIDRIRDFGTDAEMITERKRGLDKEHVICSFCKGVFVKTYIARHKQICQVAESTTDSPVTVPLTMVVEDKFSPQFREKVLAKFLNNEVGDLCRTDPFVKQFGCHRYKRAYSRVDKKIEVKINTMSEMRRLAGLYLAYRKEAEREKLETNSAADMFDRNHFDILEDAIDTFTTDDNGKMKSGLRRNLGYLLKKAALYLKGQALQQKKDEEYEEIGKFLVLFSHNYFSLFDAAEYNCIRSRQKKLRRPAHLPEENAVAQLRDYNLSVIQKLGSDRYKLVTNHDYVKLRDSVVCRLTLFNARRGGEPSRLDLIEWKEAKDGVWLDKNCVSVADDPLEKLLLGRFKLAYQSGKTVKDLVPNLIPEDCWPALIKLADPGIRAASNVGKDNEYLFPSTEKTSECHVSGWYCCDRACKDAGIKKTITATAMRHRASTIYAGLDVSESDREIFYRHMGHSAEINRDVYQCPVGTKEIIKVGGFLSKIDGQSPTDIFKKKATEVKCREDTGHTESSGEQQNDPVPSTSGESQSATEVNSSLSEYDVQAVATRSAFLEPLVDEYVMLRAVSGRALIDEDEVEIMPKRLMHAKDILCDISLQDKMKKYFTDDGWNTAMSTINMMEAYIAKEDGQPARKKRKRKAMEDSDDSYELHGSDYSSEEHESECYNSEEDTFKKKSAAGKGKKLVKTSSMAKRKERQYYQWKEQDSDLVKQYFKESINDISYLDSRGSLPGKKIILQFLAEHPILNDLKLEERIAKVKTKILNERNKIRQKFKKDLEKYVQ